MEIQQLKDCCVMMLEPVSNPSVALVNETVSEVIDELHLDHNESASEVIEELHLDHNESVSEVIDELHLDHNESVFLAGGYDGISWLSALDSYSHDGSRMQRRLVNKPCRAIMHSCPRLPQQEVYLWSLCVNVCFHFLEGEKYP